MTKERVSKTVCRPLAALCATVGLLLLASAPLLAEDSGAAPVELAAAKKKHPAAKAAAEAAPAPAPGTIQLYEDPVTGQLFTKPGAGRRALAVPAALLTGAAGPAAEIDQRIEQKARAAAEQEVAKFKEEQGATNAAFAGELQQMQPAWREFGDYWFKKIKIGALVYADYAMYTHTTWAPQELTQLNPPGPQNNIYNAFDLTRAYVNFFFTPTDDMTIRITPNIYRALDGNSNFAISKNSTIGSNIAQQPTIRFKYAYLDWMTPFKKLGIDSLKDDKLTFGQQQNPLVDWEESLYGFRYVNLTPWNYYSLSSTHIGLSAKGPVKFNELQYLEYDVGVFNNASFTSYERGNTKQAMARLSAYPFGAGSRFDGLGITGFYDWGYTNVAPDITSGSGKMAYLYRLATFIHYTKETWGLAGEFDLGHNAFTGSNLFSGSGPADFFTAPAPLSKQSAIAAAATGYLNPNSSQQMGYAFFGHAQVPQTPFTLFGMFHQWFPNTKADVNPFDFQRFIVGVEYKYNKYLRFALNSQNVLYYHSQFTLDPADVVTAGGNPAYKTAFPKGIKDPVPRDLHAIFLNVELSY